MGHTSPNHNSNSCTETLHSTFTGTLDPLGLAEPGSYRCNGSRGSNSAEIDMAFRKCHRMRGSEGYKALNPEALNQYLFLENLKAQGGARSVVGVSLLEAACLGFSV